MPTYNDILEAFNEAVNGVDEPVVMVHSSYKTLGRFDKGPGGIIDALIESIGPKGTLLIPTFNFTSWSNEHYYGIVETPSEMGVITEYARMRTGFVRTKHPIYSFVVYGHRQAEFLNAESPSTMGANSIFDLFHASNGGIISIGLDFNSSFTMTHHVELSFGAKHRRLKDFGGVYMDIDRIPSLRTFQMYVRSSKKLRTFINPAMEILVKNNVINLCQVDNTLIHYAKSVDFYDATYELLEKDPGLFFKGRI